MSVRSLSALYERILSTAGLIIGEDGLVYRFSPEGATVPATVDNKRLYIPNETAIRVFTTPDKQATYMGFHPLSESVLRAQSPVIKWLRNVLSTRLQVVIGDLMAELAAIAADPSRHKSLSPRATEFLSKVPEIDVKTIENLRLVLCKLDGEKNKLLNIYLKQGGNFDNKAVHRSAVVTFPFLKEFENDEHSLFDQKIRKKDRVAIEALFNWMIPDAENINTYSVGSVSTIAPYFHALINAYIKVAIRLNDITRLFKKQIDHERLHIDIDWAVEVVDLTPYRESLPALSGNEGEMTEDSKASTAVAAITPTPIAVAPLMPTVPFISMPQAMSGDPYKGLPTLGAEGKAAEAATLRVKPKDTSGMDFERTVIAHSMGYSVTPPPGTPLGFAAPVMGYGAPSPLMNNGSGLPPIMQPQRPQMMMQQPYYQQQQQNYYQQPQQNYQQSNYPPNVNGPISRI